MEERRYARNVSKKERNKKDTRCFFVFRLVFLFHLLFFLTSLSFLHSSKRKSTDNSHFLSLRRKRIDKSWRRTESIKKEKKKKMKEKEKGRERREGRTQERDAIGNFAGRKNVRVVCLYVLWSVRRTTEIERNIRRGRIEINDCRESLSVIKESVSVSFSYRYCPLNFRRPLAVGRTLTW